MVAFCSEENQEAGITGEEGSEVYLYPGGLSTSGQSSGENTLVTPEWEGTSAWSLPHRGSRLWNPERANHRSRSGRGVTATCHGSVDGRPRAAGVTCLTPGSGAELVVTISVRMAEGCWAFAKRRDRVIPSERDERMNGKGGRVHPRFGVTNSNQEPSARVGFSIIRRLLLASTVGIGTKRNELDN